MTLRLTFLGGAGTVTGSKTQVETSRARVLVDCGLFQGFKHLRLKNRAPFPTPPSTLDAVVLTHAHLDHSGYLPALVRAGFAGKVFCSVETAGIVAILLKDAAHLEEEQAAWLKKKSKSKHADPAAVVHRRRRRPRHCPAPAHRLARRRRGLPGPRRASHADRTHPRGVFRPAARQQRRRPRGLLWRCRASPRHALPPPQSPPASDVLVLESTYGGRRHEVVDPKAALADIVTRTVKRGGIVMIPAFAVGRAQTVLHLLRELIDEGAIPTVPVFLNSPMAAAVTRLTVEHRAALRITDDQTRALCALAEGVATAEDSKALNRRTGPMIVVAGSGMMTGGRITHHLAAWGPDPKNTVVVVGFQAPGTRGASLLGGAPTLRLFGDDVPMRAEVVRIDMLSGHADGDELLAWLRSFSWRPRQVLLNHGEADASDALRLRMERELEIPARVMLEGERVEVTAAARAG